MLHRPSAPRLKPNRADHVFPKGLVVILLNGFEDLGRQQAAVNHPAKLALNLIGHEEGVAHALPRDIELLDSLWRSLERDHHVTLVDAVAEDLES